jgi:hypothetical protein
MIKFKRLENDSLVLHSFDSYENLKIWIDNQIQEFKIKNRVQNEEKDRSFITFKSQMETYLNMFKNVKCYKCEKDAIEDTIFLVEGTSYKFCKDCQDILNTFPNPIDIIPIFMETDQEMGQVTKSIFDGRKRRLKGEGPWKA